MFSDIFDIPDFSPSVFGFESTVDEFNNSQSGISLDIASDLGTHYLASFKEIKTDLENDEINSQRYSLGISSDPEDETVFGFDIEQWRAKSALRVESYKLEAGFNFNKSSFQISRRYRPIRLYTNSFIKVKYSDLSSNGNSIAYQYKGIKNWSISAEYLKNSYSKKVSALATVPILQLVYTPNTLLLASGFEKTASSIGITYYANAFSAGLSRERSISAIDGSALNQNTAHFSFELDSDYLLGFKLSNAKVENETTASLSLSVTLDISFY